MQKLMRISLLVLVVALCSASALAQYSSPVRDVENPAHSPLRISATASVPQGFVGSFGNTVGPTLDATRRYVIEYVTVECPSPGGVKAARVSLSVAEKQGAGWYSFHTYPIKLEATQADYTGNVNWVGTNSVRLYHDGGQALQLGILLSGAAPAGGLSCSVRVSGYTVSMP